MTLAPLVLGPLEAEGYKILRSGVRWLVDDGQYCPAHRPCGYFNVSLEPAGKVALSKPLCADEMELQVAFAPRVSGRIQFDNAMARGGYLSIRTIEAWEAGTQVAQIDTEEPLNDGETTQARLLMLAGRRMTALADVHTGLMPGWHSRSRGWWSEAGEKPLTLLSLGVCDAAGVVTGAQTAFTEMFEAGQEAAQMVYVPDHPIAPCVPILLDQLERTPAQFDAIARDMHAYFGGLTQPPSPDDWMFLGTMLSVMQNAPLKDEYTLFTSNGLQNLGPPDAVLLSLAVEPQSILRHRKLGYHMHVMRHHQAAAGPAVRTWLQTAFEPVKRPIDSIRRDYEKLIDGLKKQSGMRVMCLNRMSTSGHEDISSYMGFDAPLSDTLSQVAAKEMNLMLHDISADRDFDLIDVDAIAAQVGGAAHVPDGIHQSGQMQAILRTEILGCLANLRS